MKTKFRTYARSIQPQDHHHSVLRPQLKPEPRPNHGQLQPILSKSRSYLRLGIEVKDHEMCYRNLDRKIIQKNEKIYF